MIERGLLSVARAPSPSTRSCAGGARPYARSASVACDKSPRFKSGQRPSLSSPVGELLHPSGHRDPACRVAFRDFEMRILVAINFRARREPMCRFHLVAVRARNVMGVADYHHELVRLHALVEIGKKNSGRYGLPSTYTFRGEVAGMALPVIIDLAAELADRTRRRVDHPTSGSRPSPAARTPRVLGDTFRRALASVRRATIFSACLRRRWRGPLQILRVGRHGLQHPRNVGSRAHGDAVCPASHVRTRCGPEAVLMMRSARGMFRARRRGSGVGDESPSPRSTPPSSPPLLMAPPQAVPRCGSHCRDGGTSALLRQPFERLRTCCGSHCLRRRRGCCRGRGPSAMGPSAGG